MAVFKVLYPCAVVEGDVVKQVMSGTVDLTDAVAKPLVESGHLEPVSKSAAKPTVASVKSDAKSDGAE